MARRRMIDPNFWQSQDVSRLEPMARMLLIGMISNADDYGKNICDPVFLRSRIFPYDDIAITDIKNWIEQIVEHIGVDVYEIDGSTYYIFSHWDKWQRVDKPQFSPIPYPETVENADKGHSKNDSKNDSENDSRPIIDSDSDSDSDSDYTLNAKSITTPRAKKTQYAEFVSMTNDEYEKLVATHGLQKTQHMIEILDNYKGSSGKKYKSDYRAILSWVIDRVDKDKPRGSPKGGNIFYELSAKFAKEDGYGQDGSSGNDRVSALPIPAIDE